ncbi:hypothetical protein GFV14_00166 [Candidatus Hartigia pinicola]|nr:hypothetical protein GFV14_00166 [Candidatus Hartigia pinicola]
MYYKFYLYTSTGCINLLLAFKLSLLDYIFHIARKSKIINVKIFQLNYAES